MNMSSITEAETEQGKRVKIEAELYQTELQDGTLSTAVVLVCRLRLQCAALPAIASVINSFLNSDLATWTLETASRCGFAGLLDRLGKNAWIGMSQHFRQDRFDHAIEEFFDYNSKAPLEILKWWVSSYLPERFDDSVGTIFCHAVDCGRLDVIQWLHAQGKLSLTGGSTEDDFDVFCSCPEIAYWLHDHAEGFGLKLSLSSCTEGNFPFLQWAIEHKDQYEIDEYEYVVDEMCYNGMLDELKLLHKHGSACFSQVALEKALQNDQVAVAKWLYTFPKKRNSDPCRGCGEFATINWVVQNYHWNIPMARVYFFESATIGAACNDDLKALKLAFKNRTGMMGNPMGALGIPMGMMGMMGSSMGMMDSPMGMLGSMMPAIMGMMSRRDLIVYEGDHAMSVAAGNGNLEMVQWLHKHGAEQKDAMDCAARHNHLDMIQWMHGNGSKGCTASAMNDAAARNHLEMVQWLHEHRSEGCTTSAMNRAAAEGHMEMVQWLHQHRSEGCTTSAMDNAVANGHLEMVKWLHENRKEGCSTKAMDRAAANGNLEMVTWLHKNRTEGCTTDAMDNASANGHWEIVQFLHKHRQEGCTEQASTGAAKGGHLKILKWLCSNVLERCTKEALNTSALNGQLQVAQFLTLSQHLVLGTDELKKVAKQGQYGVVEWLLKQYHSLGKLDGGNPFVDA